jgi:hypothetical protein
VLIIWLVVGLGGPETNAFASRFGVPFKMAKPLPKRAASFPGTLRPLFFRLSSIRIPLRKNLVASGYASQEHMSIGDFTGELLP